MAQHPLEVFGTPQQQELQRRSDLLWTLLRDDPRFSSHGRAVALSDAAPETLELQIALARLIGVCPAEHLPAEDAPARRGALAAAGLEVDAFAEWAGDADALAAAEAVAGARGLPADLSLASVDAQTPPAELASLDRLTRSCGVLLPAGPFLRGRRRPGVCLFARDGRGQAVACAAAVAQFHPDHARGGCAWWGMLATAEHRRGEGLALRLGAEAMRAMKARHGFERFFTGIREGNAASEALCRKLGLRRTDRVVMIAIDPDALAGGRLTK